MRPSQKDPDLRGVAEWGMLLAATALLLLYGRGGQWAYSTAFLRSLLDG